MKRIVSKSIPKAAMPTVRGLRKVYTHCPVSEKRARMIVWYLTTNYGERRPQRHESVFLRWWNRTPYAEAVKSVWKEI